MRVGQAWGSGSCNHKDICPLSEWLLTQRSCKGTGPSQHITQQDGSEQPQTLGLLHKSRDFPFLSSSTEPRGFVAVALPFLPVINLSCCLVARSCPTLCNPMELTPGVARLLCPWNLPGKNTGVSFHFLLQRIFLTLGLNPHLLVLYSLLLSHQGSPNLY